MKLGLGTAQFGLDYGVTNNAGRVPPRDVGAILQMAANRGMEVIDTAPSYGTSEDVLGAFLPNGHHFKLVTKTLPLNKHEITQEDAHKVRSSFLRSLERLRQSRIYGVLVHDPRDLLVPGSEHLMDELHRLRSEGLVSKVGVSVYRGDELDYALERHAIDLVQLPVNVLDQRLVASGHLRKLRDRGIEIHARSIFLQGLLLAPIAEIPPYLDRARAPLQNHMTWAARMGLTQAQCALAFVEQLGQIDHAIVGATALTQLQSLIESFGQTPKEMIDFSPLACNDVDVVDPTLWLQPPARVESGPNR